MQRSERKFRILRDGVMSYGRNLRITVVTDNGVVLSSLGRRPLPRRNQEVPLRELRLRLSSLRKEARLVETQIAELEDC